MATKTQGQPDLAIHPGEILAEELEARSMTQVELASQMERPVQAVNEIIKGKKAITAATALELEKALGVPAHVWVNLQGQYELTQARLAAAHFPPRRPAAFAFTKNKAKKK
jgi:HTH-type transcriptional regulator/antitoxin HigA